MHKARAWGQGTGPGHRARAQGQGTGPGHGHRAESYTEAASGSANAIARQLLNPKPQQQHSLEALTGYSLTRGHKRKTGLLRLVKKKTGLLCLVKKKTEYKTKTGYKEKP